MLPGPASAWVFCNLFHPLKQGSHFAHLPFSNLPKQSASRTITEKWCERNWMLVVSGGTAQHSCTYNFQKKTGNLLHKQSAPLSKSFLTNSMPPASQHISPASPCFFKKSNAQSKCSGFAGRSGILSLTVCQAVDANDNFGS
jgi:hypothetical protein